MARIARVVVPHIPHHITQRGNRNQNVFFSDADRNFYLHLIRTHAQAARVAIWAYCLMDNHVHFIAVPETQGGLMRCFQEAHRLYTRRINFREGWRGYLWQGRFASFPMDEPYLIAAIRYVELNPVKAGLVSRAEDYPWSSACAHVFGKHDPLLSSCYVTHEIPDWSDFLNGQTASAKEALEKSMRTGRPLGSPEFIEKLEAILGRTLKKQKAGRRAKLLAN